MESIYMMDRIIIIMENGKMTKNMGKEYISFLMEFTMDNGDITKWKVKGHLNLIMEINIEELLKMELLVKD